MNDKRPLPFQCKIYDKGPVKVIMAQKGLIWFRKYFPKEYMILLD